MVARQLGERPRAGRPRRLSPLPLAATRQKAQSDGQRPGKAPGLAQSIQLRDLLRATHESDSLAARRLAVFMRFCDDHHRAFGASGGVARYQPGPAAPTGPHDDALHLRKVKALARFTRSLRAVPKEASALLETLVALPNPSILQLMQQNKAQVCWALDQLCKVQQTEQRSAANQVRKAAHGC